MRARGSTERFRRAAIYLTPFAFSRLEEEAARRSQASGLDASPEVTARALVYASLGVAPDGLSDAPAAPAAELVATVRAVVDHGRKAPLTASDAIPKLNAMAAALEKAERSLGR